LIETVGLSDRHLDGQPSDPKSDRGDGDPGEMGSDGLARENQRRPSFVEPHEVDRPH
jgi:hypothetical protein